MRILLTTDTVGGVWTFTCELTREFLTRGHKVALFSLGGLPSRGQQTWCDEIAQLAGNAFYYGASDVPLEWMQNNEGVAAATCEAIAPILSSFCPDIMHANQFCLGQFKCGVPILVTAHSDVLSWAEACKPEGLSTSPWLTEYRRIAMEGMQNAAALTAPTKWMAATAERLYTLQSKIAVIPNGRSIPSSSGPAKHLQAVTAGRLWDPGKGLHVLAGLKSSMPIYIAGDQQSEPLPPLPAGAVLTGSLPESALLTLFAESAVYLATSIYEPFGLASLEAALTGCAVLAREIPSLREVWGDGALYFHDTASLDTLLAELTHSAAQLAAAQQRSLARAQRYTAAAMAERYLAAYEELLPSPHSATALEAAYVS